MFEQLEAVQLYYISFFRKTTTCCSSSASEEKTSHWETILNSTGMSVYAFQKKK